MVTINYLNEIIFSKDQELFLKKWVSSVIELEKRKIGEINFIICNDDQLLNINQKFLNHDTYTDIITFPTSNNPEIISSEIYISISRVRENARLQNILEFDEICRVFIHGLLHLLGYKDHSESEKKEMRAKEDYCLTLRP
jgi:rRNA maturation RNase YbeY